MASFSYVYFGMNHHVHLFCMSQVNEGTWVWTNGVSVVTLYWYPGQPDNSGGRQHCLVVNFHEPGKWDDETCTRSLPFVCQIDLNV